MKITFKIEYFLLGCLLGVLSLFFQVEPVKAFSITIPNLPNISDILKSINIPQIPSFRILPITLPNIRLLPISIPIRSPRSPIDLITLTPSATPSSTPTPTITLTPTNTPIPSSTPTITPSSTPTITPIPTVTPTRTVTPIPTSTSTPTLTPSETPTLTITPTPSPTTPVSTDTPTPTPTSTTIITRGPLGYWPMEETSGTVVPDVAGTHPLTISGVGNWTTDAPIVSFANAHADTRSLSLDGTTYAFNSDGNLCPQTGYTIEAWVKVPALLPTQDEGVVGNFNGGNGYLIYSRNQFTNQPIAALFNTGGFFAQTPTRDNTWHHLSQTWDGAIVRIYIDGKEEGSQPFLEAPNCLTGTFIVGGYSSPVHSFLTGHVDEVKLYDYARSSSQIVEDAGITAGTFPSPTPTP